MNERSLSDPDERILHEYFEVKDEIELDRLEKGLPFSESLSIELITEGSGVHCIGKRIIPCKAGELYILPPGISHGYFLTEIGTPLVIRRLSLCVRTWLRADAASIGTRHYCHGVFSDGSELAYAMLNAEFTALVKGAMDTVERELSGREHEWRTVVSARIAELLSLVARYVNRSDRHAQSKDSGLVLEAEEIIARELGNPDLSLSSIAARLFVSPPKLSRIFKAERRRLFSDYLRDARMTAAAALLREGDESVESIAARCGLRDLPSFYRNFRQVLGVPPQAYRQLFRADGALCADQNQTTITEQGEKEMEILKDIASNVQNGKSKVVRELVQNALDAGISAEKILNEGLVSAMSVVGEKFKNSEIYVPEVLVAARAMSMGAQILKPHLSSENVESIGRVCIGTVQGDLHDIGKNLVKMLMEGKGLEVVDLGTDVSADTFIKTAIEENCRVICCSALLTTTMPVMAEVVKKAEEAGIRDKVKIMVGGAPVNEEFAKKIGADAYAADAASAADAAIAFCKV